MGKQSFRLGTGDITYKSSATNVSSVFGQTLTTPSKTVAANFAASNITHKSSATININDKQPVIYVPPTATNKSNFPH